MTLEVNLNTNDKWKKHFNEMIKGDVKKYKKVYLLNDQKGEGDSKIKLITPTAGAVERAKAELKRKVIDEDDLISQPAIKRMKIIQKRRRRKNTKGGRGKRKSNTKKQKKRSPKKNTKKKKKKKKKKLEKIVLENIKMSFKLKESQESHREGFAIMGLPPVDTAEENCEYINYRPIAQLTEGAALEFNVPGTSSNFINLQKSRLAIRVMILKLITC